MKLSKDKIYELVENSDTIHLSSEPFKHDISIETYIAKIENKYYKFSFERSYNEGWMIYDNVDAIEVIPKEKVIIEWMPKNGKT